MTGNNINRTPQELLISMVLDAWHAKEAALDKLLAELSDEQLERGISPGRNRGIYLLGHLVALTDSIFPMLGYDKQAMHLFEPFVLTPDNKIKDLPTVADLRKDWTIVKAALAEKMVTISPDEWLQKHTAVSAEDFAKEAHRNKLNVVLSRVGHMDYHIGQMQLLKTKN